MDIACTQEVSWLFFSRLSDGAHEFLLSTGSRVSFIYLFILTL